MFGNFSVEALKMRGPIDNESSSEEEAANWKAAIESIASTTTFGSKIFGAASIAPTSHSTSNRTVEEKTQNSQKLKHYRIKAQRLLDDILEKTLAIVNEPIHVPHNHLVDEGGVRLFKHSPVGIVYDHIDEIQGPKKRPRILPGCDIDGESKEFRRHIKSIAVDGIDIISAAREAGKKALTRLEAKESMGKAKSKEEEERIAELKRIRGEKWLPSIAKEMQLNRIPRNKSRQIFKSHLVHCFMPHDLG